MLGTVDLFGHPKMMRGFAFLVTISSLHSALFATAAAYQWPDPQYEVLERLLYEGTDINDNPITILTNSCGKRAGDLSPVAAEWLRLSYHDSATHNITDGTGGYYELNRTENIGGGMVVSMNDFAASSNKYVSRADLIALGAVWGVASCAGPVLPFRGGRVDALAPGRFGVPQPEEGLALATEHFAAQGFNATEMIALVACGHTLGGVRNVDFPTVVQVPGPQAVLRAFDGTDAFDAVGVAQYLNGTTQNPLVTVSNTLFQSDLRIFSSDGNVTLQSMNSPAAFNATCAGLLERMINTVPSNVQLTDTIALLPFKVTSAQLTIQDGQLLFDVLVRVAVTAADETANTTPRAITLYWCDARGPAAGCPSHIASFTTVAHPTPFNDVLVSPVTSALRTSFVEYELAVPVDPGRGVGRFWFEALGTAGEGAGAGGEGVVWDNGGAGVVWDNGGAGYAVDDGVVFLQGMGGAGGVGSVVFDVVVGRTHHTIRHHRAPRAHRQLPELHPRRAPPTLLKYTLYTARFTTPNSTTGRPTVDIAVEVDGVRHTVDFARPLPVGAKGRAVAGAAVGAVGSTTVAGVPTAALSTSAASASASATAGRGVGGRRLGRGGRL
ncbi:heme peroxidase [Pholiota molesta]|nr:heme peroxidase [Pholiota molesta]